MRIRAKLLSKGSSPVTNQTAFAFPSQPSGIRRSDSETSNTTDNLMNPPSYVPNLIMPSPSLPNLNVASMGAGAQLPFGLPSFALSIDYPPLDLSSLMAAQLTPFLSLPSLLKAQLGLGLNDDVRKIPFVFKSALGCYWPYPATGQYPGSVAEYSGWWVPFPLEATTQRTSPPEEKSRQVRHSTTFSLS